MNAELIAAGRLIVNGAIPATKSGQTCFVPRYQIDRLRDALDAADIFAGIKMPVDPYGATNPVSQEDDPQ